MGKQTTHTNYLWICSFYWPSSLWMQNFANSADSTIDPTGLTCCHEPCFKNHKTSLRNSLSFFNGAPVSFGLHSGLVIRGAYFGNVLTVWERRTRSDATVSPQILISFLICISVAWQLCFELQKTFALIFVFSFYQIVSVYSWKSALFHNMFNMGKHEKTV